MRPPTLLLASSSPRRSLLLRQAGIAFETVVPGPEVVGHGAPSERAMQRARSKACFARTALSGLVLGVDTVVALGDEELGKPADRDAARRMLLRLAGREHLVHTGHCLHVGGTDLTFTALATARVSCDALAAERLERYLDSGEWAGKAGSYGIQDAACDFMHLLDGSRDTVIGLHVATVTELIERWRARSR